MERIIAGIERLSPFVRSVKITRSDYLVGEWVDYDHVYTYIEQGEAEILLDGVQYRLKAGEAILFPPMKLHFIRSASSEPLVQYIFHFDLFHWEDQSKWQETGVSKGQQVEIKPEEELLSSLYPISFIHPAHRLEVHKRFHILHQEFLSKRPYHQLFMKSLALELLIYFLRNQHMSYEGKGKKTKGWASIEKAVLYIQQEFANPRLDLEQISLQAGVSTNHLSYLFKEQLGVTIHKYVTYVRIEEAKRKLLEGNLSITQISETAGFASIHAFSRTFKAIAGLTASQFIEAYSTSGRAMSKEEINNE
ncbi:helix-turn-helix domain-containing protein [Paenibacillus sp. ATY16]|uniref:helix-turn-helix transcriptional regulator n=1 Tax=Paenibacillus sp. ATY16 TaxID=1759312 RepID=UPI00200EC603|nr:helix-turn-helix domain-containing protein [Paenibacillus sp. ATY16]MCK9862075.1 AraC family transcriptional regulator [Paenibacillus sp. ATY16]